VCGYAVEKLAKKVDNSQMLIYHYAIAITLAALTKFDLADAI
jgi:hypothetical protein